MKHIQHIFFDLDHTLWDYEKNAFDTIQELLIEFQPHYPQKIDPQIFYAIFSEITQKLWVLFRENKITLEDIREKRVKTAFGELNIDVGSWMLSFSDHFLDRCPHKTSVLPGTLDTLNYLSQKYTLHIISNGISTTQSIKLKKSGIGDFMQTITCSDDAQSKKPHHGIFNHALQLAGAHPRKSIYIGDNYMTDVMGGVGAGIETIFFHPEQTQVNLLQVQEIASLKELTTVF